ncbi:transposase [Geomesophilobacter sediminis]|uniref:transposase n=1 Tax=Geomesophilobacter sediminis TaxID=2798584 RepID=UPI001F45D402|nr:transposase [Geomesophilobacter sediminis]
MPRLARLDIPGILQHVMVRGIEKREIFIDDRDRTAFVDRLSRLLLKTGTDCLAWSLLSNHVHLLLRPTKLKLADMMRRLLTGYAVVFNLRHHRSGHLFQNRYKSIVCDEDTYLLELVRYIHLNPLRAGLVSSMRQLDAYQWSGHSVILGHSKLLGQVSDEILAMFGAQKGRARKLYRAFVADGIALGRRDELVGGGLKRLLKLSAMNGFETYDERILGSGGFVEGIWHESEPPHTDEPLLAPPIHEIIERVATVFGVESSSLCHGSKQTRISKARSLICFIALKRFGYRGVDISKILGISRSAVILAAERESTLSTTIKAAFDLFPEMYDKAAVAKSETEGS